MPVVYRCSNCGAPLEIFVKVGQNSYGVPTPSEVATKYGGTCFYCGAPLKVKPSIDDIEINPEVLENLLNVYFEAQKRRIRFKSLELYIERFLERAGRRRREEPISNVEGHGFTYLRRSDDKKLEGIVAGDVEEVLMAKRYEEVEAEA